MTAARPRRPTDGSRPPTDGAPLCPYCGRPFPTPRIRALHLGRTHPTRLTGAEHERFEAASAAEAAELRRLRLWAIAALVVLYFGLLFAYSAFA